MSMINSYIDSTKDYFLDLQYYAEDDPKTLDDLYNIQLIYDVSENYCGENRKLDKIINNIINSNPKLRFVEVNNKHYTNVNSKQNIWTWQRIYDNLNKDTICETDIFVVSFNFVSLTTDKSLPQEVLDVIPDIVRLNKGRDYQPELLPVIEVSDGFWTNREWSPHRVDNISSHIEFIGGWEFDDKPPPPEPIDPTGKSIDFDSLDFNTLDFY